MRFNAISSFFQPLVQTWVGLLVGRMLCAAALVMRDRYWSSHTLRSCHVKSLSPSGSFLLRRYRGMTLQNAHCFLFLRHLLSQLPDFTWQICVPSLEKLSFISPACLKLTYTPSITDRKDSFSSCGTKLHRRKILLLYHTRVYTLEYQPASTKTTIYIQFPDGNAKLLARMLKSHQIKCVCWIFLT